VGSAVQVEQLLGEVEEALSVHLQRLHREGVEELERDVPGHLVLAHVVVEVGGVQALQVMLQALPGEQPLARVVPECARQQAIRAAELVVVGPLRLA
jgi:hypothetical protein